MRKLYKVISWDHSNNEGVATDGTKYEGQFITYRILGVDLYLEQNGFLVPNEIISAKESAGRYLYDIFIEAGPRAIRPAEEATAAQVGATDTEIEAVVNAEIQAAVNTKLDAISSEIADSIHRIDRENPHLAMWPLSNPGSHHFLLWTDRTATDIEQRLRNLEAKVQKLERTPDSVDDHR